jgi:hypothetical protein
MLLTMRAYTDAMRSVLYLNASCLDVANRHDDPAAAQKASDRAELLTPISKAWCTDVGCEMTSLGIQVHGGYGYIEETGAAQHFRDARISPIYEGTNGIQALDLIGRKLPMNGGQVMNDLLTDIEATIKQADQAGPDFAAMVVGLTDALAATREANQWIADQGTDRPNEVIAGATPYLRMFGQLVGGWLVVRQALFAQEKLADGAGGSEADHLASKIVLARFYAQQLLPVVRAQLSSVTAGADDLYAVPADGFAN